MAKTEATKAVDSDEKKGKHKHRSPNYPLFDLEKAVERAKSLYDTDKLHKVPIGVAQERWAYKKHGAAGNQAVAAVKSYGLITVEGEGEKRMLTVTDSARKIILNAPDRPELLKQAALSPPLFASLWGHFRDKGGVPSNDLLRHYLVFDRNFNEDVVEDVMSRFRDTMAFAKITDSDKITGSGSESTDHQKINIGDYVQWTLNGVDRFPEPQPVKALSEDGEWAFFETTESGIPMSDLSVVDKPVEKSPKTPPISPFYKPSQPEDETPVAGIGKEVTKLDEGQVLLTMPDKLSAASVNDFEYWITGIVKKMKRKAGITDSQGDKT